MASDKDTIYIDIDDEITGIIDKLKASDGKVVALVLPKRASVFQSIVNMKLLKRAADNDKKHVVLITSEAGLLPLAGAAGVHVAKTLTSKPELPAGPDGVVEDDEAVDEDAASEPEIDPDADGDKPIGQLVGARAAVAEALGPAAVEVDDGVETLELDDDTPPEEDEVKPRDFTPPPKAKKDKKLHVPNFENFRKWLIIAGILLLLVIAGFLFANYNLAKATINIKTDASAVDANADLELSTTAQSFNPDGNVLPAKLEQSKKTYTAQVPTTGQTNTGDKATGTITLTTDCVSTLPDELPAGSGVSTNGQTYITQDTTDFASNYQTCGPFKAKFTSTVDITAQTGGASYNVPGNTTFNVAGRDDLSATGSASGGTDNIVQSVNQNDITSAKSKLNITSGALKQSLANQLSGDGYFAITDTYSEGTPNITQSAQVGQQANTLTVTETITYTMFGTHKSDLQKVIKSAVQGQIDTSRQTLLDYGLSKATFTVNSQNTTSAQLSMSAKTTIGPQLDVDAIKQEVKGQHSGEIKDELTNNPDVKDVEVKFSPFWISTVPNNPSRITVNIAKPEGTSNTNGH